MASDSRALIEKLRRVQKNARRFNIIEREAAEMVADAAAQRAPEDTGALAQSIEAIPQGSDYAVHVGEDYGRWVNLEEPFIRPAAKSVQPAIRSMAAGMLEKLLDR
jgi:hypothetical protein